MATEGQTFDQWLKNAKVPRHALSPQQLAVLQAAFGFLQRCGRDYWPSTIPVKATRCGNARRLI